MEGVKQPDKGLDTFKVIKQKYTAESAFLFRDHDHPFPSPSPSCPVLNRPTSLSVLNCPEPSLRVLRTNNA